MCRMLAVYLRTHGHCLVPFDPRLGGLGSWLAEQHRAALACELDPATGSVWKHPASFLRPPLGDKAAGPPLLPLKAQLWLPISRA